MNRLRECREKSRLSQKYVALSLYVKAPSVANWESGKTCPTHENLVKLADLYGVSVDYLLGRTDIPKEPELDISKIEYALSGEIRSLSENEMQDVLEYIRFKKAQRAKK